VYPALGPRPTQMCILFLFVSDFHVSADKHWVPVISSRCTTGTGTVRGSPGRTIIPYGAVTFCSVNVNLYIFGRPLILLLPGYRVTLFARICLWVTGSLHRVTDFLSIENLLKSFGYRR